MTDAERWKSVQELFDKARALDAGDRGAFLDAECQGDVELRNEVQSILDAHQLAGEKFIEPPTGDEAPERIGPYRILTRVGEGGMGTVYAAEQLEPLRRTVALKVIKLGMDTKEVLARFEAEHGALNVLDHPSIARVHDAGKTEQGRPYFVMEYVAGVPVTQYCDTERLTTRERLDLFLQICSAIQHAHQKGIVHRDLKPSNILVTLQDGQPVPKIIDFGIAKAVDQRLTEQTLFTEVGQMIGTPEYMSPEQAGTTGVDVDTRTDVYSLGVILYELLTGSLPFDATELRSEGLARIQQIIREVDPPRPSTRVSTVRVEDDTVASSRRTDRRTLVRGLRGELDWIVMRAMEKSRSRRYDSVSVLAADIVRHINHEPVLAGPPSRVYRMQKLVRKHRGAVVAALLVFVALLVGLVATYFEYQKAETARETADHERRVAEDARAREEVQRKIAEDRYEEIIRLSDLKRLEECRVAAEELWPAHPDRIEAIERWLTDSAEPLVMRLAKHRLTLSRLRRKAASYGDAELRKDRETHPRARELKESRLAVEWLTKQLEDPQGPDHAEYLRNEIKNTEERITELDDLTNQRRTWELPDTESQWQHDAVRDLVDRMVAFSDPESGVIASVRRRLEFARRVGLQTLTAVPAKEAWQRAKGSIAQLPVYEGLELEPQLGLIPLGLNEQSGLWEFWHVQTGSRPKKNDGSERHSNWAMAEDTGIVFVLIPGGTYWMGAQRNEETGEGYDAGAEVDEGPVHQVTLAPFFLSKYELTQGQWESFTGSNPSEYIAGRDLLGNVHTKRHPVEQVSWNESKKVLWQLGLVLPTEAQWEYASRAGTTTPFWCGTEREDVPESEAGNFSDAWTQRNGGPSNWLYEPWEDGWAAHAPVGTFAPNPWGIHDVIGNVWEWCRDYHGGYEHPVSAGDGFRRVHGGSQRVLRGGSFINAVNVGSATREYGIPELTDQAIGVRPARPLDKASPSSLSPR